MQSQGGLFRNFPELGDADPRSVKGQNSEVGARDRHVRFPPDKLTTREHEPGLITTAVHTKGRHHGIYRNIYG